VIKVASEYDKEDAIGVGEGLALALRDSGLLVARARGIGMDS
jgi:hypothetical protein